MRFFQDTIFFILLVSIIKGEVIPIELIFAFWVFKFLDWSLTMIFNEGDKK